ncbi:MAG: hypothetical protein Q9M43_03275 [Sulfurimonas sp.]|nr:hypothetical protein [Sulfurimonas sp.]
MVSIEEIHTLAKNRSQAIKTYLIDTKGVEVHRIQELEILESPSDEKMLIKSKLEVIVK